MLSECHTAPQRIEDSNLSLPPYLLGKKNAHATSNYIRDDGHFIASNGFGLWHNVDQILKSVYHPKAILAIYVQVEVEVEAEAPYLDMKMTAKIYPH